MTLLPPLFFALILSVVDGDTVKVRAFIWLGQTVEISVRIAGIDTPELHGKCPREKKLAGEAKAALARLLPLNTIIELRHIEPDKYGRVLAFVATANNVDVAGELMKRGLARSYSGKTRQGWC
mgnify:CR=1 FL=1